MPVCAMCGSQRADRDVLAFRATGTTTSLVNGMVVERPNPNGFVCRPDRWMRDGDFPGFMRSKRRYYDETGTSVPCIRGLTTQPIIAVDVPVIPYTPEFSAYPVRPGTEDWDRLMVKSGGIKALRGPKEAEG